MCGRRLAYQLIRYQVLEATLSRATEKPPQDCELLLGLSSLFQQILLPVGMWSLGDGGIEVSQAWGTRLSRWASWALGPQPDRSSG